MPIDWVGYCGGKLFLNRQTKPHLVWYLVGWLIDWLIDWLLANPSDRAPIPSYMPTNKAESGPPKYTEGTRAQRALNSPQDGGGAEAVGNKQKQKEKQGATL